MKKVICSQQAPGAIGPYSQAIEAGGMVFVSGQLPIDAATGMMAEGAEAQARRIRHVSPFQTSPQTPPSRSLVSFEGRET